MRVCLSPLPQGDRLSLFCDSVIARKLFVKWQRINKFADGEQMK